MMFNTKLTVPIQIKALNVNFCTKIEQKSCHFAQVLVKADLIFNPRAQIYSLTVGYWIIVQISRS